MNLPDPMTPLDCDLRGYDYMPMFGHRLFASDFYAESTAEEFRTAMRLWWACWLQTPAGSLPTSDNALAVLADYGRDLKGWARVKERALHGFVLCSDGRLYHSFLSEEAVKAYALRLKNDTKRAKDRERLQAWRDRGKTSDETPQSGGGEGSGNANETPNETCIETEDETRFVAGRREVKLSKKETPSLRSVPQTRRTRIDPTWQPDDAGCDRAAACGITDLHREVSKFRDHHTAKGSLMADWPAAWRTWCGNAQQFARPGKPGCGFSAGPLGALEVFGLTDDLPFYEPRKVIQ